MPPRRIRITDHARERWQVRGNGQSLDHFLETALRVHEFDEVPHWLRHHAVINGPDYAVKPGDKTIAVALKYDRDRQAWMAMTVHNKRLEEKLDQLGRSTRAVSGDPRRRGKPRGRKDR